jgi:flagellar biosynthesis GTPase FlhF
MRTSPSDVDHLFQLPLGEFTAARNALASKLKKAGRAEEAERVKRLLKPPASAWTVNQLYWRHGKELSALMDNGDRFRAAQAAQLAGKPADVRRLLDTRRQALTALTKHAADILRGSGHAATPDTMRRIMTTLEALATYGTSEGAPAAGRLTDDLDPPGFEALAALVPRDGGSKPEGEPSRVLQFRQETRKPRAQTGRRAKLDPEEEARRREEELNARRAAAREAVQAAEQAVQEARATVEQAEAALKQAAAKAKAAEQEKAEAEQRLEQATAAATEATREARAVARQAEEAAQAVSDAERELERARQALDAVK